MGRIPLRFMSAEESQLLITWRFFKQKQGFSYLDSREVGKWTQSWATIKHFQALLFSRGELTTCLHILL